MNYPLKKEVNQHGPGFSLKIMRFEDNIFNDLDALKNL